MVTAAHSKQAVHAQDQETPEYVTVSWFARKFGKARSTIHRACEAGRIAFIPFPSAGEKDQKLIPYSEVDRLLSAIKSR